MVRNTSQFVSLAALLASMVVVGCSDDMPVDAVAGEREWKGGQELPKDVVPGKSIGKDELPTVKAIEAAEVFVQKLPQSTKAGENVAVHIRLPEPDNKELSESLVRVVGDPKSPLVLFRTDALVELGQLKQSPGKEFFTTFVKLNADELKKRGAIEAQLGKTKTPAQDRIVFDGRTPIAITTGIKFDFDIFDGGGPVALGPCPVQPLSEPARWEEALMITDLQVVQDPDRTNDVCDPGADNPDGVWTFKHLMREMATGSGLSTHDFVVAWLSTWLTDVTVNGDTLPARTQMFDQVILPWANASGISASLAVDGTLTLGGELDLDRAPFSLSAIVNRIDLGATATGGGGYGGSSTSQPTTAGEMRFVFGVQNLDFCNQLPFSVIFEYGVPISGCSNVKQWALDWTSLSDPSLARFSDPWRDRLEDLSQAVVVAGAAPGKGNDNAINQVRTNEIALFGQWQFREFTLSTEDPSTDIDTPASGPLRPHTVAMTPDDTEYDDFADSRIDDFVLFDTALGGPGRVRDTVPATVGTIATGPGPVLTDCSANYAVPQKFNGDEFRGGDAFTGAPNHWRVDAANPGDLADVCAREQFSLNTCNGCHLGDTSTGFFHVDPQSKPAFLSNFVTGGPAGIWSVPDQQFGAAVANMQFNDLDRRHNRLYEIACAQCGSRFDVSPAIFDHMVELAGVVPVETGGIKPPFPVGPIKDIGVVKQLLSATAQLKNPKVSQELELGKLVRKRETFVH